MDFLNGNAFVSKKSTRKPTNQVVSLDSPSEFRRFLRQGQGESGDSKFFWMLGFEGEKTWRFVSRRENKERLGVGHSL